jgi:preprotein translocase subunit Sss1
MANDSYQTEFVAAAVGEVGMAWGHVQRALLYCRRSGREEISQIAVELNGIGIALTGIEDRLRGIFESSR